jgi:hypothetical protein
MKTTWAQRIKAARKRGSFTADELSLAVGWNTCAMGEAVGTPATDALAFDAFRKLKLSSSADTLGISFVRAVDHNDFDSAELVLKQIAKAVRAAKRAAAKAVAA